MINSTVTKLRNEKAELTAQIESVSQEALQAKDFIAELKAKNDKLRIDLHDLDNALVAECRVTKILRNDIKSKDNTIEAWGTWGIISAIVIFLGSVYEIWQMF